VDDEVFRALADPTRRGLLDALRERDGQTLTELERRLPITRFGVAKHLRVLEQAGLVVSRKSGRSRHHHLNAVPIQRIQQRWVSRYAEPWANALLGLKTILEEDPMNGQTTVYELYICTTPEDLWHAITSGEMTRRYYFGSPVESDWQPGSRYVMTGPDGQVWVEGEVLEADPPRRLVQSFRAHWDEEMDQQDASQVTWEIAPQGDACRLRVTHEGLTAAAAQQVGGGWPQILSGLKTLLETGEPLVLAGA